MNKFRNFILITQLFSFNLIAMHDNRSNQFVGHVDNVPQEIKAIIADYCLGNLPDTQKIFKEQLNNILNLKLTNKKWKSVIDKYFDHGKLKKICDLFENHLYNFIKSKNLTASNQSKLAARLGSKQYFENTHILNFMLDLPENCLKLSLQNKNFNITKFIWKKFIAKNLKSYKLNDIKELERILTKYKNPKTLNFDLIKDIEDLNQTRYRLKLMHVFLHFLYLLTIIYKDVSCLWIIPAFLSPIFVSLIFEKIDKNIFSKSIGIIGDPHHNFILVGSFVVFFILALKDYKNDNI